MIHDYRNYNFIFQEFVLQTKKALYSIAFKREIYDYIVFRTRVAQMVERPDRELEDRVSNPGPVRFFSFEI